MIVMIEGVREGFSLAPVSINMHADRMNPHFIQVAWKIILPPPHPLQHIKCKAKGSRSWPPAPMLREVTMDHTIITPKLKLILLTAAERGSREFEWLHELRSDEKATWWRWNYVPVKSRMNTIPRLIS